LARHWTGVGLVVVGVERRGLRFSLSHIADQEWRAVFMSNPMFAPAGFGVAPTPWRGGAASTVNTGSLMTQRV
jgi:hypothetical protein